jgi:cytochrome c-type biogenesis protein CcmF
MSILAICLWGMLYPLVSELLTGQKVTVGPPFYERATGPLFGGLLLLMGVAPLSAWGHATLRTLGRAIWIPGVISLAFSVGLWWRGLRSAAGLFALWLCFLAASVIILDVIRAVNARSRRTAEPALAAMVSLVRRYRRRYGGYLVHLGVVCMGVGIIGIEVFQSQTQGSLQPGESLTLAGYQVTYRSLDQFETPGERSVSRAVVDVSRDGQPLGQVYPRRDYYNNPGQSMTIPGVRSTLRDDLYILLVDWQPITRRGATFRIYHNPLINWLWLGAVVFILGTLVAAWPENEHTLAARRQAAEDNDKRQD